MLHFAISHFNNNAWSLEPYFFYYEVVVDLLVGFTEKQSWAKHNLLLQSATFAIAEIAEVPLPIRDNGIKNNGSCSVLLLNQTSLLQKLPGA